MNTIDLAPGEAHTLALWLTTRAQLTQLRHEAYTDPLTGAWNRRYFERFTNSLFENASSLRRPVTILLFDIDDFKRYNDAYGPLRFDNHLGPRLTEIVRLNVAQTTRCQVCVAGRVPAATEAGLTEDLIARLASGDLAGFTDAEAAAITSSLDRG